MSKRANVLALAILIVMVTAGAAQSLSGSDTVFTDDIVDGEVRARDIGADAVRSSNILNGNVRSGDVADDSLGGTDINENQLDLSDRFAAAPTLGIAVDCDQTDVKGVTQTCATRKLRLTRPGWVQVIGYSMYNFESSKNSAGGMSLLIDGQVARHTTLAGTSDDAMGGFELTAIKKLTAGEHTFTLVWGPIESGLEGMGDVDFDSIAIDAIQIGP
jgi:hypothetical protein